METQQPSGAATEGPGNSARGGYLTALLVLMIILNSALALLYFLDPEPFLRAFPRLSHSLLTLLAFGAAANVVFAILAWNWRRSGLWGLVGTALLAFPINLYAGLGIPHAILGLLGPLILALLVRPKWASFK